MGNSVKRSSRRVVAWLSKHHVTLVVLLSLLHIGLSCIHARESGGVDRRIGDDRNSVTRRVRGLDLTLLGGHGGEVASKAAEQGDAADESAFPIWRGPGS